MHKQILSKDKEEDNYTRMEFRWFNLCKITVAIKTSRIISANYTLRNDNYPDIMFKIKSFQWNTWSADLFKTHISNYKKTGFKKSWQLKSQEQYKKSLINIVEHKTRQRLRLKETVSLKKWNDHYKGLSQK